MSAHLAAPKAHPAFLRAILYRALIRLFSTPRNQIGPAASGVRVNDPANHYELGGRGTILRQFGTKPQKPYCESSCVYPRQKSQSPHP